jgi:hypothetical protein
MRWWPAARFSVAADVTESSEPALPRRTKPSFRGKQATEGREELAEAHRGLADEYASDGSSTPWWKT